MAEIMTQALPDPIDQLLDTLKWSNDIDKSVAARLQIKAALNERERLRDVLDQARHVIVGLRNRAFRDSTHSNEPLFRLAVEVQRQIDAALNGEKDDK